MLVLQENEIPGEPPHRLFIRTRRVDPSSPFAGMVVERNETNSSIMAGFASVRLNNRLDSDYM
jgi:hypothetical protein